MEVSLFADPTRVGPGIWFKLHLDAAHAVTPELGRAFIQNTHLLLQNFKCATCQEHFRRFTEKYPLEEYTGQKQGIPELFRWTWKLHNQVNQRLGKYQPTLEEAYGYYRHAEVGICHDCGTEKKVPEPISQMIQSYREKRIVGQPFLPQVTLNE